MRRRTPAQQPFGSAHASQMQAVAARVRNGISDRDIAAASAASQPGQPQGVPQAMPVPPHGSNGRISPVLAPVMAFLEGLKLRQDAMFQRLDIQAQQNRIILEQLKQVQDRLSTFEVVSDGPDLGPIEGGDAPPDGPAAA